MPSALCFWLRRSSSWMPKPKKSPCSATDSSRRWCWKRCPAANSPAAPRRSPPATTRSPHSERTSVSVDTLLEWALRYRNGGFEALAPQPRQDRGQSRTITPQLADLIERLKRENPHRTGTTLLRELALSSGKDCTRRSPPPLCIAFSNSAASRKRQLLAPPAHKKFEAEHSNQIWQSDMLFGPYVQRPGGGKMQACCMPFSMTPAGSSRTPSSMPARAWMPAWTACARPSRPAACRYASTWTTPRSIAARNWRASPLPSACSSCTRLPISPRGAGKSNDSSVPCREQFLDNLDRKQTLSLEELNERLWAWIDNAYHRTEHSSLGTTPAGALAARYRAHPPTAARHRSSAVSSSIAWIAWCAATAPSCCKTASTKRRRIWPARPSKCASIRSTPPSWRSISRANREGTARLVDPVVNGQLPSAKPSKAAEPEPTGINFVDLLIKKKDEEEPPW